MATGDKTIAKPVDFRTAITDRIRAEFVSLIPDEQWEAMVQQAVKDFTTRPYQVGRTHDQQRSPFEKIVHAALEEAVTAKVATEIAERVKKLDVDDVVEKLVSEKGEQFVRKALSDMANNVIKRFVHGVTLETLQESLGMCTCPRCGMEHDLTVNPQPYCCGSYVV